MNKEHEPDIKLKPPRRILDRKHNVGIQVFKFEELKGTIATDQTGRFPITSRRGNAYIMCLYDYNSNVIDATAVKSRNSDDLITAYEELHKHLQEGGIQPVLQKLDNEVSKSMIEYIKNKGMKYQLANSFDHRTNPAERAVQTFKKHFISILYGADPTFPANQWDRLIPQAVMTLNMLRPSRINPKISAYNQVWGNFDFSKTPLAPPGCKVIVHESPEARESFAPHGKIGYYIAPAMNHY